MKQVTLVSLYGQKQQSFAELIRGCSDNIFRSPLRGLFKPHQIDQVHGTIVGMEKLTGFKEAYNARIWEETGERVIMDFSQMLPVLEKHFPLTVQFGGFSKSFNEFESFGHSPYERSFQIQWETKRFTLIGWVHQDGDFTTSRLLQKVRDEIENKCHIRHKYRRDNDLFMVLGEIAIPDSMTDNELAQLKDISSSVEVKIRDYLADNRIALAIDLDALSLVQYEDVTLSLSSTVSYSLKTSDIDTNFIESLYD